MDFKDVEKEFKSEIYEKKKLSYGNRNKTTATGKSGSRRGMRTPYDYMDREEKEKLNSEVVISNLDDIIIKKSQFDIISKERQKELLTHWRDLYDNKTIMKEMGINSTNVLSRYIHELDIPKKRRITKDSSTKKRKATTAAKIQTKKTPQISLQFEESTIQSPVIENMLQQPQQPKNLQPVEGLHLNYNGIYDAEQLSKIFTKLQLLTDEENCKFKLHISLTEEPQ